MQSGAGGAVSRVLSWTAIRLDLPLPTGSSSLPERSAGRVAAFCLALLRMGFGQPRLLPAARCALTAPFHPCLCRLFRLPSAVLLSVPLSVMLPCPAVSRHPALCSPDFPPRCRNSAAAVCPACARRIIQASGQPERRCCVVGKRSQYCQALPPCL